VTAAAVLAGDARWCVVEGDALDVLPTLPAASVNALVTDPPSGIAFMGAEWDRDKGGRAQWVAWLAQVLSLARAATAPGGRALVWALPRTAHWTGCAVEDAGWAIESKLYHLFGTGWPKGKSQLKPAAEEWLLARTGPSTPLNVDAVRVGTDSTRRENRAPMGYMGNEPAADGHATGSASGRYPPNVLLSHGPGCVREGVRRVVAGDKGREWVAGRGGNTNAYGSATVRPARGHGDPDGTETVEAWRCEPGCAVATLDAQAGERTSGVKVGGGYAHDGSFAASRGGGLSADGTACYGDTGGASRFFPQLDADDPDEVFRYAAKPSRAEKNAGCEEIGPVEMAHSASTNACGRCGRRVLGRVAGGGCECGDLRETARRSISGNAHPTVKPVALMRWLIRLVTKPGDVVLDPFCGSGTTGVAALAEGRRFIGVERDPAFAAIARARMEHAAPSPERLRTMTSAPVRVEAPDYGPLFGGAR